MFYVNQTVQESNADSTGAVVNVAPAPTRPPVREGCAPSRAVKNLPMPGAAAVPVKTVSAIWTHTAVIPSGTGYVSNSASISVVGARNWNHNVVTIRAMVVKIV